MSDLLSAKREMRSEQDKKRKLLVAKYPDAALQLRDQFLKHIPLPPRCVVAAYHAHGSEINPAPLATSLHHKGCILALPAVTGRGVPLAFRTYAAGDKLQVGIMGTMEPLAGALRVDPDVLLVPLLAFDKRGYRLGYGGGYYDRTLKELRQHRKILAIGLAYAGQEVPAVPIESHDVRLDKIVTETGLLQDFLP